MMGGHDSGTGVAAAEFNERLARTDGDSVAGALQEILASDRAAWLDNQLLSRFKGSPWPGQAADESRCRDEVSIFQAVEAAHIAREAGYVAEDRATWFADWMLRLALGAAESASRQAGLARYWRLDLGKRVDEFASALAALLPEPVGAHNLSQIVRPRRFFWEAARVSPACYFVRTLAPLLHFRTFVGVSSAFHDDSTAQAARRTLDSRDRSLMEALDEFVRGGGVNYLVAQGGAWLTSVSEPHGVILPIFTLREAADRAHCDGQDVVCVDNREMLARTPELQRLNVRYVAVISHATSDAEQEASLLPIDRFLQIVKNSVDRSNTGDLARAYRKAVTA
jgi:hypothetical protein